MVTKVMLVVVEIKDPDEKVIVTYEVLNLTLTQAIIDELKGSTNRLYRWCWFGC